MGCGVMFLVHVPVKETGSLSLDVSAYHLQNDMQMLSSYLGKVHLGPHFFWVVLRKMSEPLYCLLLHSFILKPSFLYPHYPFYLPFFIFSPCTWCGSKGAAFQHVPSPWGVHQRSSSMCLAPKLETWPNSWGPQRHSPLTWYAWAQGPHREDPGAC